MSMHHLCIMPAIEENVLQVLDQACCMPLLTIWLLEKFTHSKSYEFVARVWIALLKTGVTKSPCSDISTFGLCISVHASAEFDRLQGTSAKCWLSLLEQLDWHQSTPSFGCNLMKLFTVTANCWIRADFWMSWACSPTQPTMMFILFIGTFFACYQSQEEFFLKCRNHKHSCNVSNEQPCWEIIVFLHLIEPVTLCSHPLVEPKKVLHTPEHHTVFRGTAS